VAVSVEALALRCDRTHSKTVATSSTLERHSRSEALEQPAHSAACCRSSRNGALRSQAARGFPIGVGQDQREWL
jgi:hypothetical protein